MAEATEGLVEGVERILGETLVVRSLNLDKHECLGPQDFCHVTKEYSSTWFPSSMAESKTSGYFHYPIGLDTSGPGGITAYMSGMVTQQEKTGWVTSGKFKVRNVTFCVYNAFDRTDLRLETRIPGGTKIFVVDSQGTKREPQKNDWAKCFVSSVLRAINIGEPKSPELCSQEGFGSAKAYELMKVFPLCIWEQNLEKKFVLSAKTLFWEGCKLGSVKYRDILRNVKDCCFNYLAFSIAQYFTSLFRARACLDFFSPFIESEPLLVVHLVDALLLQNEHRRAHTLVEAAIEKAEAKYGDSSSKLLVPLLLASAKIYMHVHQYNDALTVLTNAARIDRNIQDIWLKLAECYFLVRKYDLALLALNVCSIDTINDDRQKKFSILSDENRGSSNASSKGNKVVISEGIAVVLPERRTSPSKGNPEYSPFMLSHFSGHPLPVTPYLREKAEKYVSQMLVLGEGSSAKSMAVAAAAAAESLCSPDADAYDMRANPELQISETMYYSDEEARAFKLLVKIVGTLGWDDVLELREDIFYSEDEIHQLIENEEEDIEEFGEESNEAYTSGVGRRPLPGIQEVSEQEEQISPTNGEQSSEAIAKQEEDESDDGFEDVSAEERAAFSFVDKQATGNRTVPIASSSGPDETHPMDPVGEDEVEEIRKMAEGSLNGDTLPTEEEDKEIEAGINNLGDTKEDRSYEGTEIEVSQQQEVEEYSGELEQMVAFRQREPRPLDVGVDLLLEPFYVDTEGEEGSLESEFQKTPLSRKFICQLWLDQLFHHLHGDLTKFFEWQTSIEEEQHEIEEEEDSLIEAGPTGTDLLFRGYLAERLEQMADAEQTYHAANDKGWYPKALSSLVNIYADNGHIEQSFLAARLLLEGLDPDEYLSQPPPVIARALFKLVAQYGLQRVRKEARIDIETVHQVIHITLHDAVRLQTVGFDQ